MRTRESALVTSPGRSAPDGIPLRDTTQLARATMRRAPLGRPLTGASVRAYSPASYAPCSFRSKAGGVIFGRVLHRGLSLFPLASWAGVPAYSSPSSPVIPYRVTRAPRGCDGSARSYAGSTLTASNHPAEVTRHPAHRTAFAHRPRRRPPTRHTCIARSYPATHARIP